MKKETKKRNWLYLLPMILTLSVSQLFIPFDVETTRNSYTVTTLMISKIIPFVSLLYIVFNLGELRKLHLFFFLMPLGYFIFLVFESLYLYGTPFRFPHVFLKLTDLFNAFAIFIFYKKYHETNLTAMMNLIMIMLFVRIAMEPQIISLGAFVSHDRALHAPAIYLLLVPCLFFFNKYLIEFKNVALVKFLILLFFIIYFQHRTVWVATAASFFFNLFLLKRQNMLNLKKSFPTIIMLGFVLLMVCSLILTYLPQSVIDKFAENITNITNPDSDTTGTKEWRMLQYMSYWPWVKTHLFAGMGLPGFELPIQFYHPEAGTPYFDDGTGHHFHSFYYDILFYFGLIGVFIFVIILVHPIFLALKYKIEIDQRHLSLMAFSFSGMIFGVSYNVPGYYWAMFGLAWAYLEVSKVKHDSKDALGSEES